MTQNGNYVTWRELNLLREVIESGFKNVNERLDDLETKVETRHVFWRDAWMMLVVSFVSAAVGTGVWFIFA